MNLDRALVLLLASASVVAGFAPAGFNLKISQLSRGAFVPKVRFGSTLFNEVEEATETSSEVVAPSENASAVEAVAVPEAASAPEGKSIYVGNISFDCTESDLRDAFAVYGTVVKVTMPINRNTNKSRGFAFVMMSNDDETSAAIEALHQSTLHDRTISVSESLAKDKLEEKKKSKRREWSNRIKVYVGNLDFGTSHETLVGAFNEYGTVHDCFMPTDENSNQRGFAFITMDEENALKAIEELNRTELDGRTLNVNKSVPKGEKQRRIETKLYVGNLSWGTEEGALRELFEEYGDVIDCYVPVDRETGQHRGFAFVTMNPDDAMHAADETDGYELDGRILRVNEAQPKGYGRSSYSDNDGYDGGDAYDEAQDESWGNEAY